MEEMMIIAMRTKYKVMHPRLTDHVVAGEDGVESLVDEDYGVLVVLSHGKHFVPWSNIAELKVIDGRTASQNVAEFKAAVESVGDAVLESGPSRELAKVLDEIPVAKSSNFDKLVEKASELMLNIPDGKGKSDLCNEVLLPAKKKPGRPRKK